MLFYNIKGKKYVILTYYTRIISGKYNQDAFRQAGLNVFYLTLTTTKKDILNCVENFLSTIHKRYFLYTRIIETISFFDSQM